MNFAVTLTSPRRARRRAGAEHRRRSRARRLVERRARRRSVARDARDRREGAAGAAGDRARCSVPPSSRKGRLRCISRRIFLKNGGLALVSLGFAPAFLARTAAAADAAAQGAGHDLPARRGRRPEHDRAVRRARRTTARGRASPSRGRARSADAAIDLDGFFGLHPRLAPLKPLYDARQLAIVHACGSPDGTRSHFDAQDYMETATPGVKSTQDGWLNRYLHAREHQASTPFRAVALAPQLPASLQGIAPALAIGQLGQFGIRAGQASELVQAVVRGGVRGGGGRRAAPDRTRGVRRGQDAQGRRPGPLRAGERRRVPALRLRRGAPADRPADQGGRRARGRLCRIGQLGSPRQRGRGQRPDRHPAGRLRARHRRAGPRPRRPHGTTW